MSDLLTRIVLPACRQAGFWVIYDPHLETAVLPVQLEDALVVALVRADDEAMQVQVSMPGLLSVPAPRRGTMALALSRWNFEHLPMLLAMDPDDGEVRAALAIDLSGVQDPVLTFAGNLTRLVSNVEQIYPVLARLRWAARTPRRGASCIERQVAGILRRLDQKAHDPPPATGEPEHGGPPPP